MTNPTDAATDAATARFTITLPEPDFSIGDAYFYVPKPYSRPETPRGLRRARRRRRRNLRHWMRHGCMWDPWHGWVEVTPMKDDGPPTTTCAPCLADIAERGDAALTVELAQELMDRHGGVECAGTRGLLSYIEDGE